MTKTDQLNALFDQWIAEFPEYDGKFVRDGIVDENCFEQQHPKILFVAKEPNDPDQEGGDFRAWWLEEVKYLFAHRVCEWAYGILNGFPPITDITYDQHRRLDTLKAIAFMNVKKIGGGSTTNTALLEKTIDRERHLLSEEIAIIEPDIVVGGLGETRFWQLLFPDIELIDSGFDIFVGRYGSFRVIDYYHPSYRVPRSMSYALLGRVYTSSVFSIL